MSLKQIMVFLSAIVFVAVIVLLVRDCSNVQSIDNKVLPFHQKVMQSILQSRENYNQNFKRQK